MNEQLDGLGQLTGTYIFDLHKSYKTRRLNRFFWDMIQQERREEYLADPEALMQKAGLTQEEMELVKQQYWIGLIHYGVNFFVLEKFARVVKKTNLEIYAEMRGETYEEFMNTRRVPTAI